MSKLTIVSGVNHHLEAFSTVSNGMKVRFVHDSENTHSENAVWVVVDGVGIIGHVTEGYVPAGFRAYGGEAIRSPDILNGIIRKNLEYEAIIQDKKPNGCLILFKITSEEVVEEMEEDIMDKWEIGTTEEVYTLVGCGHFVTDKKVGDKVSIGVENYAIDDNGKIKGTACAFNEMGEVIGLFPQSQRKFADCEEMRGKYASGDEIKGKYASDLLETDGYVIIDISKDGRFIKLGEPTNDNEEIDMNIIKYGFNKMSELITLYDAENIVEEVIEETATEEVVDLINDPNSAYNRMRAIMPNRDWAEDKDGRFLITKPSKEVVEETATEEVKSVTAGEDMLRTRIDEIKASIDAKKAELNQLEADLEMFEKELANVEHRNALISEIKDNIFGLATEDIIKIHQIVMNDVASSSTPEEDVPSSIEEENFVIDFKDHYEERISRFEQSDIQKENNTCDIVLYYASNTWGSERTIKNVKLSDNVVEYLKSVIPHNQCMGEHVIELEMALEAII